MRTSFVRTIVLGTAMSALVGAVALAGHPVENVGKRHPNIAAAQELSARAFEKLEAAQTANEFDLGGHAKKAKEALKLANDEMKLAAEAANKK